ncbi:hypothetical protein SY88_10445 [Clostridiales bacterium PH28_bin88]|nr:hypothetical protein SY88_10445 [Clostridiales bacterium PH28_bin88]
MKVTIEFRDVLWSYCEERATPEKQVIEFEYDENTTIQELFDLCSQSYADLSNYYRLSGKIYYNCSLLPYLMNSEGRVIWNVSYAEARVTDFLKTHAVSGGTIYADTGIPQAGGVGVGEVTALWSYVYPVLEQVATLMGLSFGIIEIARLAQRVFVKKEVPPQSVFDLIISRDQWSSGQLADALGLDKEEAKKLLQVCGFRWDRRKMMYVAGDNKEQIIAKLSRCKWEE